MQFLIKQYSFNNKLIIRRGSLSKPSILEQLPREIYTFYFFVPNRAIVASIVSSIAF